MEAVTTRAGGAAQWARHTFEFLTQTRVELRKVTWPTKDELWKATRMIILLSVVMGFLIGWLDLALNALLVNGVAWLAR